VARTLLSAALKLLADSVLVEQGLPVWRGHSCLRLWSCLPTRFLGGARLACVARTLLSAAFEVACWLSLWVEHGSPVWRGHSCPRPLTLFCLGTAHGRARL